MKKDSNDRPWNCIIIFFIITALAALALNHVYINLVIPETKLYKKVKDFEEYDKRGVRILLVGDSHIGFSINQSMINESYNYAIDGSSFVQTFYHLEKILENEELQPDTLIMPLDLHSFSSFRITNTEPIWFWVNYLDFLEMSSFYPPVKGLEQTIRGRFPFVNKGKEIIRIVKNKVTKKRLTNIVAQTNESETKRGADGLFKESAILKRVDGQFKNCVVIERNNLVYFERILNLAQKRNITLVLVKFPVSQEYYDKALEYVPDVEGFYANVTKVTDRFNNVHILDFHDVYFDNSSLFHDPDHLNAEGMKEFTGLFAVNLSSLRNQTGKTG